MYPLFQSIIDTFFPPSSDARLVRTLNHRTVMHHYAPRAIKNGIALMAYKDPAVRALIHEAKFSHNTDAIGLLGIIFNAYISSVPLGDTHIIIPIPLSATRERARGYNQVTRVLIEAAKTNASLLLYVQTDILFRTRHTTPQTSLSRTQRLTNLIDAFTIRTKKDIRDAHILLVDDVCTTGATFNAARQVFASYGVATIDSIAFAH